MAYERSWIDIIHSQIDIAKGTKRKQVRRLRPAGGLRFALVTHSAEVVRAVLLLATAAVAAAALIANGSEPQPMIGEVSHNR
eukprot:SAG31_NODE_12790_length_916_cov_4.436965_2_plen_82_part_00